MRGRSRNERLDGGPGRCPKCEGGLANTHHDVGGGAFRSSGIQLPYCNPCEMWLVPLHTLHQIANVDGGKLTRSYMERERKSTEFVCTCGGEMDHVTYSWDELWAQVEECQECQASLINAGELTPLSRMVAVMGGAA